MTADDIAAHRGDWVDPISTAYRRGRGRDDPAELAGHHGAHRAQRPLDARLADGLADRRLHAQIEAIKVAWSERDRCVADPDRGLADASVLLSQEHARWLAGRLSPDEAQRARPHEPARRRDGLPLRGGRRRDDGQPDRVELHGLRLGDHGRLDRDHAPEPRRLLLPRSGASRTRWRRARERSTRSCRACCSATAAPRSRSGAMGGDGQPQTMVQLVTGLVDDGLDPQAAVDRPRWVAHTEAPFTPLRAGQHRVRRRGRRADRRARRRGP